MSSKSIICYIFTSYAPLNTTTKFFKPQNYCSSVSGDLASVIVKFTRQENLLRPLNKEQSILDYSNCSHNKSSKFLEIISKKQK